MQAHFDDYNAILLKFVKFIGNNEIINAYIKDSGECEYDVAKEVQEVGESYGGSIFSIGHSDEEEVRNIFAILRYIAENHVEIYAGIGWGYSSSNKFQDRIKGFNERVVMVLINHIERHLTKIGINMGLDEKINYSITVENGQVNIANGRSTINANSTVSSIDIETMTKLIQNIRENADNLVEDDEDLLNNSLDVISEEANALVPRKSYLKTAISVLKNIKGTTEFAASIATLIQFIKPLL